VVMGMLHSTDSCAWVWTAVAAAVCFALGWPSDGHAQVAEAQHAGDAGGDRGGRSTRALVGASLGLSGPVGPIGVIVDWDLFSDQGLGLVAGAGLGRGPQVAAGARLSMWLGNSPMRVGLRLMGSMGDYAPFTFDNQQQHFFLDNALWIIPDATLGYRGEAFFMRARVGLQYTLTPGRVQCQPVEGFFCDVGDTMTTILDDDPLLSVGIELGGVL